MPTTVTGNSQDTIDDKSQIHKKYFYCDICQKKFTTKRAKELHQKSIHDKIKDIECWYCDKAFTQSSNLATHVKKYHFSEVGDDQYQFRCPECNKDFSSKGHLKRHLENVHEKKKKIFCEICQKGFSTKADADRHLRTVHEKLRNFKCEFCKNRAFKTNALLNLHVKTVHEGLKPFECQTCNKTFSQKGNLNTHIARYHETNNDKIPELLTAFQSELEEKTAKNTEEEDEVPSTEINNSKKNFQCLFCNKFFRHKVNLKTHLKKYHTLDESSDDEEDEIQSEEQSEN